MYNNEVNMKYLTSKQLSSRLGVSERTIRNYCKQGRFSNAKLYGKIWFIPEDAVMPERKKRNGYSASSLLKILKEQKESKLKGGIYHKLMVDLTYNTNHIEGSRLNHDQTRFIYETRTITQDGSLKADRIDDILETINHFDCIDIVIDKAKGKLNERLIKQLHKVLKTGTEDSKKPWFNVGEYKAVPNEVGGKETTKPEEVASKMRKILDAYNLKEKHTIEEIIDFHYEFESIHPFQDGNGRIGRLIILKECLKNNIVPIIILDEFKEYYYRGLKEYKNQKGYLIDTCLHGQDIFKEYLDYFGIKHK